METTWDKISNGLRAPFRADEIEWRIAQAGEQHTGKPWCKVLAYITNRAIQDRLDTVAGAGRWWNNYVAGPAGGVLCGLTIAPDGLTPVTKWDGADNSDIESVKGGLSDAMKRAGVQWGMGRYLYALSEGWAVCSTTKERGPQWRYQPQSKQGKHGAFYWCPPDLPEWALPEGAKSTKSRREPNMPEAGDHAPAEAQAPAARADNPYGIPAEAWLRLDACKSYDEMYKACVDLREDSRGANPAGENWNAALNTFFRDRKAFFADIECGAESGQGVRHE